MLTWRLPFVHMATSFCSHCDFLLLTWRLPLFTLRLPFVNMVTSFCSHCDFLLFTLWLPFVHMATSFCSHGDFLLFTWRLPCTPTFYYSTDFLRRGPSIAVGDLADPKCLPIRFFIPCQRENPEMEFSCREGRVPKRTAIWWNKLFIWSDTSTEKTGVREGVLASRC